MDGAKNEKLEEGSEVIVQPFLDYDPNEIGPNGRYPTEEEKEKLLKIAGPMTWTAMLMQMVEFTERASYYGSTGVLSNFIQRPLPDGGNGAGAVAPGAAGLEQSAGALNLGVQTATALTTLLSFAGFVFPLLGGYVADNKWGRMKTILVACAIGILSHILLVIPAIPSVIKSDKALGPFIIAILTLAFATGFIKPSINPLLCDQCPVKRQYLQLDKKGNLVIVDPTVTIGNYQLVFYWVQQFGSVFSIATSYCARDVGYWLAFLLPSVLYIVCVIVVVIITPHAVKVPPTPGIYGEMWKVIRIMWGSGGWKKALKGGDSFWVVAKPSHIRAAGTFDAKIASDPSWLSWDDEFVVELQVAFDAVKIFAFTMIYAICDGGFYTPFASQAAQLVKKGVPNDLLSNFGPISMIVVAPILYNFINPAIRKYGINFGPSKRMCVGYLMCGLAMATAAIIQWQVYKQSPCGYYASSCTEITNISLWVQLPVNMLPGIGELFVLVSAYEIAYTRSPARMKGIVFGALYLSFGFAYALLLIVNPVMTDPNFIWPFVAAAIACGIAAVVIPIFFKHMDDPMENFNDPSRMGLEKHQE